MAQIYQALKNLVDQELIVKAAETLGESESNVSSGISMLLPSLLAKLHKKGESIKVNETVELAGKHNLMSYIYELFSGKGIVGGMNFGERFENAVLGTDTSSFMSAVAAKSGLKKENADRLSNWVSGLIAAYLGSQMVGEKHKMSTLLAQLGNEKNAVMNDIPGEVSSALGFASGGASAGQPKKKGYGWVWWLVLLALIIIILCWRSCSRTKAETEPKAVVETVKTDVDNAVADVKTKINEFGEEIRVKLSDGRELTIYKDGTSDKLLKFLNSDEYKKASADDLKKIWFAFDRIDYVHDSSTQLMEGSQKQLDNIIAIMNSHKDVKFVVGGFADKTGPEYANEEISKERAENLKQRFVNSGVAAERVGTEWFSEKFATVSAQASDTDRAVDRRIAIRFAK